MKDILELVQKANPRRKISQLERRFIKLSEENGEASQAYLSVTSANNSKNKTWCDVREELVDTAIVALDILLNRFPDEPDASDRDIQRARIKEFERKLVKLKRKSDSEPTDPR